MSSILDSSSSNPMDAEQTTARSPAHRHRLTIGTGIRLPLVDGFERVHRSLRISVTDVCNIRCQYCMPEEAVQFLPNHQHLTYSQIVHIARVAASLGIVKYRLTGGEPLVRPGLDQLVGELSEIAGVREIALTTNGMLLAGQLKSLVEAGLQRINISLDTLSEERFKQLSRRAGLNRVLEGIEAAVEEPRVQVRLNALILRDVNLEDVIALVEFARTREVVIRFIEFMPLDAQRAWDTKRMVSGAELRRVLAAHFGPLTACSSSQSSQPATDYEFSDGSRVGFIDTVTQPFCGACDRLRLTSDGKLRNCLFGKQEWDVAKILNAPSLKSFVRNNKATPIDSSESSESVVQQDDIDIRIAALFRECVAAKAAAHGITEPDFQPPERAMYQIGG